MINVQLAFVQNKIDRLVANEASARLSCEESLLQFCPLQGI
jgi:hypothetical protein